MWYHHWSSTDRSAGRTSIAREEDNAILKIFGICGDGFKQKIPQIRILVRPLCFINDEHRPVIEFPTILRREVFSPIRVLRPRADEENLRLGFLSLNILGEEQRQSRLATSRRPSNLKCVRDRSSYIGHHKSTYLDKFITIEPPVQG